MPTSPAALPVRPLTAGLWRCPPETYRGLMVRAAPGTHAAALGLLRRHLRGGGRVLDLAAGTGAWLARLADNGWTEACAVERDAAGFGFAATRPLELDLNGDFAAALPGPFDLVTALEIVEHLDDPRHFLRQIRAAVRPGGHLLLSTPNLGHWAGRLRFLAQAEHRYFKASDYHQQRHVSPITATHLGLMLEETGFRRLDQAWAGSFFGPLKRACVAPAALAARALLGRGALGDTCVVLAEAAPPHQR